jgi:hypothetical protein
VLPCAFILPFRRPPSSRQFRDSDVIASDTLTLHYDRSLHPHWSHRQATASRHPVSARTSDHRVSSRFKDVLIGRPTSLWHRTSTPNSLACSRLRRSEPAEFVAIGVTRAMGSDPGIVPGPRRRTRALRGYSSDAASLVLSKIMAVNVIWAGGPFRLQAARRTRSAPSTDSDPPQVW